METFYCKEPTHKGSRILPFNKFYESNHSCCIVCAKRRSAKGVYKRRQKLRDEGLSSRGLPLDVAAREAAKEQQRLDDYDSKARRMTELAREIVEEPETVEPSIFTFAGALGVFQRQPDHKCHGWAVMKAGASTVR